MIGMIRWIPVSDRMPEDGQQVVVGRAGRNFTAILRTNYDSLFATNAKTWLELVVDFRGTSFMVHDVRATDFWLPVPSESPGDNAMDGGWPA